MLPSNNIYANAERTSMTSINSIKEIGKAVRNERKKQGLTQTQLAEACNVGLTFISNLENGKETAEAGKMLHVIHMLGIDLLLTKRGE